MLKKLLTLSFFISISILGFSQSCTPDTAIKTHGYYPDALDTATELQAYSMTIQVYSKKDTTIEFGGNQVSASIDSIIINDIEGMPAGISYTCNPAGCRFVSLKTHCINLHGTPLQGSTGYYPLNIKVTVKATTGGGFKPQVNEEIQDFGIFVKDDGISSIQTLKNKKLLIYPNPASEEFNVVNLGNTTGTVFIYNTMGQLIHQNKVSTNCLNKLNTSGWQRGIYNIQISYSNGSSSHLNFLKN